jgi:hypothetical protein
MNAMVVEMSKSEFAELICVPPARVSQWLRDGTISPEALQGHGRHARVRVDLALVMLSARLARSPGADLVDALMRVRSLQAELDQLPIISERALHARNVKDLLMAFAAGIRPAAETPSGGSSVRCWPVLSHSGRFWLGRWPNLI